ncbi:MAG: hypothetical protein ACE5EX_06315, partial [Phycisphaerae bacterium]
MDDAVKPTPAQASREASGLRDRAGYLAYWSETGSREVSVFNRLLFDGEDVGQALLALERDRGVNIGPITSVAATLDQAVTQAAGAAEDTTVWLPATDSTIAALMGFDPTTLAIFGGPVQPSTCTEPCDLKAILSDVSEAGSDPPLAAVRIDPPGREAKRTARQQIKAAMQDLSLCSVCGGRPTTPSNPCRGVDCDDGNPCTFDWCNSYGGCVNAPNCPPPPVPQAGAARPWEVGVPVSTYSTWNSRSGNVFTALPTAAWSGRGPGLSMVLFHNAASVSQPDEERTAGMGFDLGPGWTTSYSAHLLFPDADTVIVVDDDGTRDVYTSSDGGATWDAPSGVRVELAMET